MQCFKDMTFCKFHVNCKKAGACGRELTDKVQDDADAWWGKPGAPISQYMNELNCFINNEEINQEGNQEDA